MIDQRTLTILKQWSVVTDKKRHKSPQETFKGYSWGLMPLVMLFHRKLNRSYLSLFYFLDSVGKSSQFGFIYF